LPKEEYYWAKVRDTIILPVLKVNRPKTPILHVLLHGEYAENKQFRNVLSDLVDSLMPNKPTISAKEPVFAVARDAAEMAKRQY